MYLCRHDKKGDMLKIPVKAGAITHLTDARYFAARGVEWLGFDFSAGSDNYIAPAQMSAIKEWVDGVKIVGEFNLETIDSIRSAITELQLDGVQVGMAATSETRRDLAQVKTLIQEVVPAYYHSEDDLTELLETTQVGGDFIFLNFDKNGFRWSDLLAGAPFRLSFIQRICQQYRVMLGIGFESAELAAILEQLPLAALHVQGGSEEKTGVKSYDDLDEIFDQLEITD